MRAVSCIYYRIYNIYIIYIVYMVYIVYIYYIYMYISASQSGGGKTFALMKISASQSGGGKTIIYIVYIIYIYGIYSRYIIYTISCKTIWYAMFGVTVGVGNAHVCWRSLCYYDSLRRYAVMP